MDLIELDFCRLSMTCWYFAGSVMSDWHSQTVISCNGANDHDTEQSWLVSRLSAFVHNNSPSCTKPCPAESEAKR